LNSLTADTLKPNQQVEILELVDSEVGQRLGELGFWPGKSIKLVISAPFGDPLAFELDNTLIALRREEARLIRVKPVSTAA
jgi:ferrous iron transport protein A